MVSPCGCTAGDTLVLERWTVDRSVMHLRILRSSPADASLLRLQPDSAAAASVGEVPQLELQGVQQLQTALAAAVSGAEELQQLQQQGQQGGAARSATPAASTLEAHLLAVAVAASAAHQLEPSGSGNASLPLPAEAAPSHEGTQAPPADGRPL
jgi:hypothetical protein